MCKTPDTGNSKLVSASHDAAVQDMINRMKQRLHRSSTEGYNSSDLAGGDNDNADRDGFQKVKGVARGVVTLTAVRELEEKIQQFKDVKTSLGFHKSQDQDQYLRGQL